MNFAPNADPLFYAVSIPAVLLLGVSKSGFGAGFGALAVPMMAMAVTVPQAAAILMPVLFVMDILGMAAFRKDFDLPLLRFLLPCGLVGIVVGALSFRLLDTHLVAGIVGFAGVRRRTGRFPPPRALIAWAAIFVWYAAMARDPRAIFWVQIAHALQYLIFPFRVELNRTARSGSSPSRRSVHMLGYIVILLVVSVVTAAWIPARAMDVVAVWLGQRPGEVTALSVLAFLNIHHYFTDGVMWKLRNPAVRQDLFGHLVKPDPVPAPAQAAVASKPASRNRPRRKAK